MSDPTGNGHVEVVEKVADTLMIEVGRTGLREMGGYIYEEFLRELQGQKATQVYREMRDNDPVVAAVLFAIEMLIRQVEWHFEPSEEDTAGEWSDFCQQAIGDMSTSWEDLLSEILTFLQYGWSYFETVFKIRNGPQPEESDVPTSEYDDGKVGWRKFAIRAQESLWRWEFDEQGGLKGMWQQAPPTYAPTFIPIEKCVLFRTTTAKGSPEGHALALDTEIPTPNGWTTMGQLRVGDQVYDDKGRSRNVMAVSEVWRDRPTYRLTFANGEEIVADANHQWRINVAPQVERIFTTQTLSDRYSGGWHGRTDESQRYRIPLAGPLEGVAKDLPVPGYALGAWLGDGSSKASELCYSEDDEEILKHMEMSGVTCVPSRRGEGKVRYARIDSFKDNPQRKRSTPFWDYVKTTGKRIPREYMQADEATRLELLRGLMDTDGSIDKFGTVCTFSQAKIGLAKDVLELVQSLGFRGYMFHGTLGTFDFWIVKFQAYRERPPFHLYRKVERLRPMPVRGRKAHANTLVSVERVESVPTVCIEVDSPSHMFLVGRSLIPTHNSVLRAAYMPYFSKRRIQEIEGIGIERDLAGLPVIEVPSKLFLDNAPEGDKRTLDLIKQLVRNIRRNEQEGIVMPQSFDDKGNKMYDLKLLTTGGRRQFDLDATVARYDQRMAMTVLADFILLGHERIGSQALSVSKVQLFTTAIGAWTDAIADVFNTHAVPRLLRLNGADPRLAPKLTHASIEKVDLQELGTYIANLAKAGMPLFPDQETENHLRSLAGLPEDANASEEV